MLRMQGRAWQPPRRNWRNRSHMAIVCCASSMSSARLSRAVLKRLMEQARLALWSSNWLRSLPRSGKSHNDSWEAKMSEQEREPDAAGGSEPPTSQEGDRLQQGAPGGGIHAETITQTTNVVSGAQYIGTQINYGSG